MLEITLSKVSKSVVDVVATSIFKVDEIGHMHDTRERRLAGPNLKVTIPDRDRDWSLLFKHENVPETWAATTSIIIVLNLTIFFSIYLRLLLFNLICGDLSFPACLIYRFWLWLVFTGSAREVKNRVFPIRGLTPYCCNWPSTEILHYAVASRFDQ